MNDKELMACIERFPAGEPITLYHTDATGQLVAAIRAKGAMVDLKPGEFWMSTEIESRAGFKGGKGLDTIARFQMDRRFVQLMSELSLSQRQAGQTEEFLKLLTKAAGGQPADIAIPRVNFEGGGKGKALPEGHVNFSLRMTKASPEMSRLFQLAIKKLDIVRLDPTLPAGKQIVEVASVKTLPGPGGGGGKGGGGGGGGRGGAPSPAEEPFKPDFIPGSGRNIRTPGNSQARMQVAGGLTLIFLQVVMTAVSFFSDRKSKANLETALKEVEDEINDHRVNYPTEGVLLRFAYRVVGAKVAAPTFVTPVQPIPYFEYLEVLYGATRDEAIRTQEAVQREGDLTYDDYQYREAWIPALVPPSVSEIRTPWKKIAVGTFAPRKAILQQVEFADTNGFDDENEMKLTVPPDVAPQFLLLVPPKIIQWIASLWCVDKVKPPVVTVPDSSGVDVQAVNLDPTLGVLFTRVTAVPVFPVDDVTAALFATTMATVDKGQILAQYVNFGQVRWVRPENLIVLETFGPDGSIDAATSQDDRLVVMGPAQPKAVPQPDPRTLAPQAKWGTTETRNGKVVYIVKPQDTLMSIAKEVYGDPQKADKLFQANKDVITDPNVKWVFPGQVLTLPDPPPPKTGPTPPQPMAPGNLVS